MIMASSVQKSSLVSQFCPRQVRSSLLNLWPHPQKIIGHALCACVVMYRIVGNFRGRKLSWIGKKWPFCGENLRGMLKSIIGWYGHTQLLWRKLSLVVPKPRNSWMFSPSEILRYMVFSGIQLVWIIEGPDKRGPDNRGCTALRIICDYCLHR